MKIAFIDKFAKKFRFYQKFQAWTVVKTILCACAVLSTPLLLVFGGMGGIIGLITLNILSTILLYTMASIDENYEIACYFSLASWVPTLLTILGIPIFNTTFGSIAISLAGAFGLWYEIAGHMKVVPYSAKMRTTFENFFWTYLILILLNTDAVGKMLKLNTIFSLIIHKIPVAALVLNDNLFGIIADIVYCVLLWKVLYQIKPRNHK